MNWRSSWRPWCEIPCCPPVDGARALLLTAVEVLAALGRYERAAKLIGWCKFHWGEKRPVSLARWQTTTHLDQMESQLGTQVYTVAVNPLIPLE